MNLSLQMMHISQFYLFKNYNDQKTQILVEKVSIFYLLSNSGSVVNDSHLSTSSFGMIPPSFDMSYFQFLKFKLTILMKSIIIVSSIILLIQSKNYLSTRYCTSKTLNKFLVSCMLLSDLLTLSNRKYSIALVYE